MPEKTNFFQRKFKQPITFYSIVSIINDVKAYIKNFRTLRILK